MTLVSPHPRQLYSGMVPGLVAGHYRVDECAIALQPLADAAGVQFVQARAVDLDPASRRVRLGDGNDIGYDVLSIDTGPVMPDEAIPGARAHAWPVRPIEGFVARWQQRLAQPGPPPAAVVVIGGGAAGIELAMALRWRLAPTGEVTLLTGGSGILPGQAHRLQQRMLRALARAGVQVVDAACREIMADAVRLPDGSLLACDLPLLAIGAAAARWLAESGLACDEHGFVLTGPTLQSRSHPEVFVVGDAASRTDVSRPKSGVYAVRAGPPLADNLRRHLAGAALREHRPQRHSLACSPAARRHAIASWNGWSIEGDWVWRWKDRIDRGFVERYTLGAARG